MRRLEWSSCCSSLCGCEFGFPGPGSGEEDISRAIESALLAPETVNRSLVTANIQTLWANPVPGQ